VEKITRAEEGASEGKNQVAAFLFAMCRGEVSGKGAFGSLEENEGSEAFETFPCQASQSSESVSFQVTKEPSPLRRQGKLYVHLRDS